MSRTYHTAGVACTGFLMCLCVLCSAADDSDTSIESIPADAKVSAPVH